MEITDKVLKDTIKINNKELNDLVEKIMKEGVPLFVREQIEKMLLRMHKEATDPLQCCANCLLFHFKDVYVCERNYIHKDIIKPWKACENWLWDQATRKRREGNEGKDKVN